MTTRSFSVKQIIAIKAKAKAKAEAEQKAKRQASRRGFFASKARKAAAVAA